MQNKLRQATLEEIQELDTTYNLIRKHETINEKIYNTPDSDTDN